VIATHWKSKGTLIIGAANNRKIRRCLHPEITTNPVHKKRLTEASQIFNALPFGEA